MEVAHRTGLVVAASLVIVHIVVGKFVGDILTRSYHFQGNGIVNRVPVTVRDMVGIPVIFNAPFILGGFIVANALSYPPPVFRTRSIITKFHDCFVVENFVLASKHL